MSLPPVFLSVYIIEFSKSMLLLDTWMWPFGRQWAGALDRVVRIVSIQKAWHSECKQYHGKKPWHWQLVSNSNASIGTQRATSSLVPRLSPSFTRKCTVNQYARASIILARAYWFTVHFRVKEGESLGTRLSYIHTKALNFHAHLVRQKLEW